MTLPWETVLLTEDSGSFRKASLYGPCASPNLSAKRPSATCPAVFAQLDRGSS